MYAGYHRLRVAADRDAARIGPYTYDRAGRAAQALDERTAADWLARCARSRPSAARRRDRPVHGRGVRARPRPPQRDQHGDGVRQRRAALRRAVPRPRRQRPGRLRARVEAAGRHGGAGRRPHLALPARRTGATGSGSTAAPARHADLVVLCAPFAALRQVDLDGAGLSRRKLALHPGARDGDQREGAARARPPGHPLRAEPGLALVRRVLRRAGGHVVLHARRRRVAAAC